MKPRPFSSILLLAFLCLAPSLRAQCEVHQTQNVYDGMWEENDSFGNALAADGNWMAVGTFSNEAGPNSGAVHVFRRVQGAWQFQTELHAPDAFAHDNFGAALAMKDDVLAISAPGDADGRGAVYVYRRSGDLWSFEQKLTAFDGLAGDLFGRAIDTDGTRIVITAPAQVLQEFDRGSAYIWVSTGSTWTLEQRIVAGDPTAQFGDSAAIEGDRVLIGAPQDTTFGYFTGVVFFFERSGSTWVQSQRFYEAGANAGHHFGAEISMSGDVAVISAKGNAIFGGAHVYRHDGIRWRHEQRLVPVKGYFLGHFGSAVATDGELVVVGDSDGDSRKGLVNTFRLDGETWSQIVQARSGNPANDDYLGASVAIARNTVVSGAPGYNGNQGTVLTFPADEHLDLELEPSEPVAGEPFQATVVYGNQGDRVLLAAKLPQGPPFGLLVLAHGTFDSSSRFSTEWRAPMAMTGVSIDFFGYGLGVCGTVEKTEVVSVTF